MRLKERPHVSTALFQGEIRPFDGNAVLCAEGMCQKKVVEQLEPFCTMCLHFDWYIPYLFLKYAQKELLETALQQKISPEQDI